MSQSQVQFATFRRSWQKAKKITVVQSDILEESFGTEVSRRDANFSKRNFYMLFLQKIIFLVDFGYP